MNVICCTDIGTTNIKTALINIAGENISTQIVVTPYIKGNPTEFDPEELYQVVCYNIKIAINGLQEKAEIKGVSFTGQRASILLLDEKYKPVCHGLTWQDVNDSEAAKDYFGQLKQGDFTFITGLPESVIWSCAKIAGWNKRYSGLKEGKYKVVLIHDYLCYRFGAGQFITDPSNASLTGLFDVTQNRWSSKLYTPLHINETILSELLPSGTLAATINKETATLTELKEGTPILVGAGDQQCATLGAGGISQKDAVLCLGSAGILNCPVEQPETGENKGFFCTAHAVEKTWVLESIHNSWSSSLNWIKKILSSEKILIKESRKMNLPLFFPFLAGIGSPDYSPDTKGAFLGLSLEHDESDIQHAVLYGIIFEMRRIIETIKEVRDIPDIKLSGGISADRNLIQNLADITGCGLTSLLTEQTTLTGLAMITWTGLGYYPDISQAVLEMTPSVNSYTEPREGYSTDELYQRYLQGLSCIKGVSI